MAPYRPKPPRKRVPLTTARCLDHAVPQSLLRGEHLSNIVLQVKRRALMRSLVGCNTQCL
jgi:hypothetical protein